MPASAGFSLPEIRQNPPLALNCPMQMRPFSEIRFGAGAHIPYHSCLTLIVATDSTRTTFGGFMSLQELNNIPGVTAAPDSATQNFVFNHTMLRVKNIGKSLDFYTRVLGFSLVEKRDFPEAEFSLYFLALVDKAQIPADDAARNVWMKSIPGILELTHNHGSETDASVVYHNGNTDPRGFGHICISVPDIVTACERFEALGVDFQKRLSDGRMKSLAFLKDPDGYWVEIIQPQPM